MPGTPREAGAAAGGPNQEGRRQLINSWSDTTAGDPAPGPEGERDLVAEAKQTKRGMGGARDRRPGDRPGPLRMAQKHRPPRRMNPANEPGDTPNTPEPKPARPARMAEPSGESFSGPCGALG